MKNENALKGKDLINIGIYATIYCVIMTCIAMLGYIPIMMPMLAVLCPFFGGIPMMLFYTKVKKFGMITIMGIIVGIYLWITGMGIYPAIFGLVFGLLADLIAKNGSYQSIIKIYLSHGVFSVMLFGCFLPIYIDSEGYFSSRQEFGQEYINALCDIMQPWTAVAIIIFAFVFGILGGILGKSLLKKHFVKAGII